MACYRYYRHSYVFAKKAVVQRGVDHCTWTLLARWLMPNEIFLKGGFTSSFQVLKNYIFIKSTWFNIVLQSGGQCPYWEMEQADCRLWSAESAEGKADRRRRQPGKILQTAQGQIWRQFGTKGGAVCPEPGTGKNGVDNQVMQNPF